MLAPIGIQPSQRSRIISLAKDIVSQNDTPVKSDLLWDYDEAKRDAIYLKEHPKTDFTLYYDTAGEIEARDVSKRLGLDAEKRKNTRPDIDRTDVVFANNATTSYSSNKIEKYTEKEYNKRRKKGSYYNEQETQFNIWQNSASTPVGAMKAFTRFDKKIHFYQKTDVGCIEITSKEFDEYEVLKHEQDYESVERRIDVLSHKYETVRKGRGYKDYNVYRQSRKDAGNDFSLEREGFQNEQSGNLERSRGDSEETSEIKLSLQETAAAGETREQLIRFLIENSTDSQKICAVLFILQNRY